MILFPGAIYLIVFIFILIALAFSAAIGFGFGMIGLIAARKLISRTATWKKIEMGYVFQPWWTKASSWAGATTIVFFLLSLYSVAGPVIALIKYLGET